MKPVTKINPSKNKATIQHNYQSLAHLYVLFEIMNSEIYWELHQSIYNCGSNAYACTYMQMQIGTCINTFKLTFSGSSIMAGIKCHEAQLLINPMMPQQSNPLNQTISYILVRTKATISRRYQPQCNLKTTEQYKVCEVSLT